MKKYLCTRVIHVYITSKKFNQKKDSYYEKIKQCVKYIVHAIRKEYNNFFKACKQIEGLKVNGAHLLVSAYPNPILEMSSILAEK